MLILEILEAFWSFCGFGGILVFFLGFVGNLVIFRFCGYFGHFLVLGGFWSFLGFGGILVIFYVLGVFWSFFVFRGYFGHLFGFWEYFGHFLGFRGILVIF